MKIRWPRLTFPPINLWNAPHQPALEDAMSDFETVQVGTMEKLAQVAAERDALSEKLAESDHALMQLGRLKAKWKAEAIGQFITEIEEAGWETAPALVVTALYTRRDELRRQAEEGSHE